MVDRQASIQAGIYRVAQINAGYDSILGKKKESHSIDTKLRACYYFITRHKVEAYRLLFLEAKDASQINYIIWRGVVNISSDITVLTDQHTAMPELA